MTKAPLALGRLHVIINVGPGGEERAMRLVDQVLAGGAPVLQLRAKGLVDAKLYDIAIGVVDRCRAAGALCIVNDRADIALAAGASGVHIGQEDLPVEAARRVVGPAGQVGGTARGPEVALLHQYAGASYLGIGPIYQTSSKTGLPDPLGPGVLRRVNAVVDLPLIAISGVTIERAGELIAAGAYGLAVIAAVADAPDPAAATARFLSEIERSLDACAARPASS